ncbi:MAG: ATP-binding cassette domain-containing protein [Gammaproteobacteria bacterium]
MAAKKRPGAGQPVVEARELRKRFGELEVVRGISFSIQPGQCFGFLGPNGAGKTTTLRMILGLAHPSAGALEVFGQAMPAKGRDVRGRIGVMPQLDNLDPDFTVAENLRVYGGYFGIPGRELDERITALLDFVTLREKANARVQTLSGGMQRRLTFARALINSPELIVLDEPTTGLDPQARHMIWSRLRELTRQHKTLLLTTHYMEEAERLCDELVIMEHGEILDRDAPYRMTRKHIESHVFELRGDHGEFERLVDWEKDCRLEHIGDTLYCYTNNAGAILKRVEKSEELNYIHRPSNLEDVFLKLTGRELRD